MSKLTFFAAFVASGMSAVTVFGYSTNEWTGAVNDWNWNEAGNYRDGLPAAGDIVQIPEATTVKLNASTDAESLAVVNSLKQIWPTAADAVLEVTVTDGDEREISKPFTSFPYTANFIGNGELRKLGGGILNLTSVKSCNGSAIQDYWTHLHVVAGSLKMAKNISGPCQIAVVTVDAGAFFYPYSVASGVSPDANSKGGLYWHALFGAGTVTNDYPTASTVYFLRPAGNTPCEFSGKISNQFRIYTAGGQWNLTGVESKTANEIPVVMQNFGRGPDFGQGVLGVRKIGNGGEASSIGPHFYMVNFRGDGGCLRYLGEGETTSKYITWQDGNTYYWNYLDGGPFGGLTLAGTIQAYQNGAKSMAQIFERIMLTGSNTAECVVSGKVLTQTKPDDPNVGQPFFGKQGSGTWRFADTVDNAASRQFGTPFVVEGGTLAFDSIAEAGSPCALGLGDKLLEPFSGSMPNGVPVEWFFALGRTNVNHAVPTLDYRGVGVNDPSFVATRKVELRGSGRIVNSSEKALKLAGVWSAAGGDEEVKYLYLGGTADQTDTIADISDGAGKTGVVKDGTGKWTLAGDLTFTGPVEVQEGTLAIRNSSRYTWFWFQVCELAANAERYKENTQAKGKTFGSAFCFHMGELGLFDKDGVMLSKNLFTTVEPGVSNQFNVAEGEISYDTRDYTREYQTSGGNGWTARGIDKLFNGTLDTTGCCRYQYRGAGITKTNSNSWNGIVFRLPATLTTPVASWDFANIGALSYADFDRIVTTINMKVSADGIRWETVTDKFDIDLPESGVHWAKDLTTKATPHTGFALPNGGRLATPFSVTPKTVKVAKGATLKAEGDDPVTINGIIASTNGVGTIDGFAFAENGTIDIPEVSRIGKGISIEADFRNCELPDASEWTLKLNGTVKPNASVAITPTGIKVAGTGLMVIFR